MPLSFGPANNRLADADFMDGAFALSSGIVAIYKLRCQQREA
jgi:hypothetical protein